MQPIYLWLIPPGMYSLTGLEENSDYTIFLTAININGSSPTVNTAITTTLAGIAILKLVFIMEITISFG